VSDKTLAIRGVLFAWASHLVAIGVAFFVTPVLLRGLGAERYGIWSIVMALTGYYGVVNMGIGKANVKYLAQFSAVGDADAERRVISTAFVIFSLLALGLVVLAAGAAWLFPLVFDLGRYSAERARLVVFVVGLKVATELVAQVFHAALIARKRFDLSNLVLIGNLAATGILCVLVVRSGGGLVEMALVVVFAAVAVGMAKWALATRLLGVPRPRPSLARRDTARMLFGFGLFELVIQLARRFSTYGGGIILGILAGPAAVAYYSVAESLTRRSVGLGKGVSGVVMPFASQFDAEGDRHAMRRMVILSVRVLLALGLLLAVGIVILGRPFLRHWIGEDIAVHVYPVICILAAAVAVKLPSNGLQAALTGMGRMRFLSGVAMAEGTLILGLGIVLATLYGAVGMAWAVLAAQAVFSGGTIASYASRNLGLPLRRLAVQAAFPAALATVPAVVVGWWLVAHCSAVSLWQVMGQIVAVAGIGALSCFFICLDGDARAVALRCLLPRTVRVPGTGASAQAISSARPAAGCVTPDK